MTKRSKLDSLVVSIRKSKRQGLASLPAAKRKALVRERGSDAVRAILLTDHPDWEAEVFELGEPASPWPYAGLSPGEVARRALGPLAERLPRLLAKLASAELVVPAHHEAEPDSPDRGGWFLIYALPTDAGHELWIAGPPNAAPEFEVEGWTLPEPLRELYAQHEGMGLLHAQFGWTGVQPGIQPAVQLAMPALDTRDEDWAPEPADLLRFTQGSGELGESGWCFARNQKPRKGRRKPGDELVICELDDEFSVLGNAVPFDFWGFLDRYLVGDPEAELPALER